MLTVYIPEDRIPEPRSIAWYQARRDALPSWAILRRWQVQRSIDKLTDDVMAALRAALRPK
jgi:hypothetical protein